MDAARAAFPHPQEKNERGAQETAALRCLRPQTPMAACGIRPGDRINSGEWQRQNSLR
jgi:hypothetical protein